jgi:putative PIN family toxin of toxin-antitoxin system
MKVVFDTNIFVSALVIPGSQAEKAVSRIIEGADVLLLSKEILDELLSILSIKFSRDKEEISRVAVILSEMAEWVEPSEKIKVLSDEPGRQVPRKPRLLWRAQGARYEKVTFPGSGRLVGGELPNRILECAISGNADVIVTGDKELLRLRGYEKTKIISLKEYLERG